MASTAGPDQAALPTGVEIAYDWSVSADINGKPTQRAVGISSNYDRTLKYIEDAFNELPAGVTATGHIRQAYPGSHLPAIVIATAKRDDDGSISWIQI